MYIDDRVMHSQLPTSRMGTPIMIKPAHHDHINQHNLMTLTFSANASRLPKVDKKTNGVKLVPYELEPRHVKWTY